MFPNALFNFLSPKTRTPTSMSVPHSLLFCFWFWLLWILRSTFEPMLLLLLCHWRAITAAAASKSNVLRLVELVLVASKRVRSAVVEYIWNNGERWGRNKKSSGRQAARERWKIHKIKKKRKKKHTTLFWHSLSLLVFVSLPRVTDVASVCQRTGTRTPPTICVFWSRQSCDLFIQLDRNLLAPYYYVYRRLVCLCRGAGMLWHAAQGIGAPTAARLPKRAR